MIVNLLGSAALGIVGGVASSALFLFIVSYVRPHIAIGDCIAVRETAGQGADTYTVKIRNLTRSQLLDVRIKAAYMPHYEPSRPRVGRGIQLEFEYPTLFDLARREKDDSLNGRSTFEFVFKTPLEPLVSLTDDWAIRIAVSAQHSVTGLGSITKANLVGPTCVRKGTFVQGSDMSVHEVRTNLAAALAVWEPLEPGERGFREATELLAEVWALGLELAAVDRSRIDVLTKRGPFDLVSELDLRAEEKLTDILSNLFPGDGVLGEELPEVQSQNGSRWIVDPLDGTVNFLYGEPTWGIALAREVAGSICMSVLAYPELSQWFIAVRGHGAFRNGKSVITGSADRMQDALIGTRFGTELDDRSQELAVVGELLKHARDVRRSDCTTLDIARVASGSYDGYVGRGLGYWDAAASSLLVEEAGGMWSNWDGLQACDSGSFVAGNAAIHPLLLKFTRLKA
jgi:fructose-1,6-bisphosphatase/inositol monophosphatase family enzyme